ncbi:MAG: RDD family protein [Acidimicrobiales bacterium]|nr:RDD family protein [Acidimicrobiales bacterium]
MMPAPPPPVVVSNWGDPTDVMGRRIGAFVIDFVIGAAIFVIAFFSLAESIDTSVELCGKDDSPMLCVDLDNKAYYAEGGKGGAVWLIHLGYWAVIGVGVQGLAGGTPGKLMVGLRVVNKDSGQLAGIGLSTVRTLVWVVDAAPWVFPLVALITGLTVSGHRRVGDLAAGTLVVRAADVGRPPQVPGLTVPKMMPGVGPPAGFGTPPAAPGATWGGGVPGSPLPPGPQSAPGPAPAVPPSPTWDAERGAYVQYDQPSQRWVQYDDASGTWKPL